MAFLSGLRDFRHRQFRRSVTDGRDAGRRPALTRLIAAPMIGVSIMALVCIGLLTDLGAQSGAMRLVIDQDLDNAVAFSRLDRELSALELASASGDMSPVAVRLQLQAIDRALQSDSLRDDPALSRLRRDMAELASRPEDRARLRNLRMVVLQRQLDAQGDALARAGEIEATAQRATVLAAAGLLIAVLLGAIAASVSLRSLEAEFEAVSRIARRLAEATRTRNDDMD